VSPGESQERWTDNHCHLPDGDPDEARAWLADARAAGVERLITVGCDIASSRACIDHAHRDPAVWATAGIHPHDAKTVIDAATGRPDLSVLEELLADERVVAVGECGLDHHYDHSPPEQQRAVFAEQIALAHRHELALVIHTREAWSETFAILDSEGVPPRTVFHCFTGGPAEAERGLALGIHLSFSGIITYKSAPELRAAAAVAPLERILVETDAPYLAPVPHRGRKNRPAFVTLVGAAVADAKQVSVAQVAHASWTNAERLYELR
jgi:TatD DNase family protein